MVDDVTRVKGKAAEDNVEILELMVEELGLIRKIFSTVHVYCICNVRGGWRFVERTVNFVHMYGAKVSRGLVGDDSYG